MILSNDLMGCFLLQIVILINLALSKILKWEKAI